MAREIHRKRIHGHFFLTFVDKILHGKPLIFDFHFTDNDRETSARFNGLFQMVAQGMQRRLTPDFTAGFIEFFQDPGQSLFGIRPRIQSGHVNHPV